MSKQLTTANKTQINPVDVVFCCKWIFVIVNNKIDKYYYSVVLEGNRKTWKIMSLK